MKGILTKAALSAAIIVMALTGSPQGQGPADATFVQGEVLIQFRAGASEFDRSEARSWVNARRREVIRRDSRGELELAALAPGIPVEHAVGVLSQHPAVRFAEPNWIYTHQATSDDPYYTNGSLWGMYGDGTTPANQYGSQAGEAWAAGQTGAGPVLVGVIDEGIDLNHEDLSANIWTNPFDPLDGVDNDGNGYVDDIHGWDFTQNNNTIFDGGPGSSVDQHGTHVSGTIGARGGNGVGVAGVNWNVTIISAKFLGPSGGTTANAIKAVNYITDLKTRHGLAIVATNNSWGGGGYSQGLHDAIIRGAKADILFMAAAGNGNFLGIGQDNDSTAHYPSNYNTSIGTSTETAATYDGVIAVASITSSGGKSSFSNYGATTVDLGAPGSSIWSTTPNNTYSSFSGTSMATPHVTGAAALYLAMHPGTSASSIKNAILASAQNTLTSSLSGKTVTGGRLNIGWFVGGAPPPPPPDPEPAVTLSATGYKVKGLQKVDLAWQGSTDVTIFRDGVALTSVTGSSYTDPINRRGGGTYVYQVQDDGSGEWSNIVTVVF